MSLLMEIYSQENNEKFTEDFNKCKEIIENQETSINELNIILKQENGYKYNGHFKKLNKHFPALRGISFETLEERNNGRKPRSFSLLSESLESQFNRILLTA